MAKKKLVLVHPNQHWSKYDLITTWRIPPTVLCRLAATVRDVVDVEIVDAQLYDMSQEAFREAILSKAPDYVGISMLTSEYASILDTTAAIIKEIDPSIVVVAGGVHITVDYDTAMRNTDIDYGCNGEGDELLRELILHLEGRGPFPEEGLIYRKDGELVVQPRRLTEDLSSLPSPAYDLVHMPDYLDKQGRYGPNRLPELPGISFTVSRGCPFGCTFCQVEFNSGKKIRVPDAQMVCDEIAELKDTYGIRSFSFLDDNLFASGKKVKAILREMIKRDLGLKWNVGAFPIFAVDDEMLDLMAEAGCVGVNVAIESGTDRILHEIIKKPIKDLRAIPAVIKSIQQRGMFVLSNFIIGLPSETWEEIRQTVRFAETCGADYVKFFVAVPLRGTKMFDMAVEMGALDHDPTVDWRFSQLKSDEWTSEEISILRAFEWDRINFSPDRIARTADIWGVPLEEINRIRQETRLNVLKGINVSS